MANGDHSRLPPSSAYRWCSCSASVKFIEDNASILPRESSPEADEGTRAHAVLTAQLKASLGQVADNQEMQTVIDECAAFIKGRMLPGDRLLVDQKVPLFYLPSQRGTMDAGLVGKDRCLFYDLKYGKGVSVYAENNKQLAIYAESQIQVLEQVEEFPSTMPIHLIIDQPRDRNDSNRIREWVVTREELSKFCREIDDKADDIRAGRNLVFAPGEACKFCPATGICKAYATRGLSAISDAPVDEAIAAIHPPLVHGSPLPILSREQRQRVLASKKDMIAWLEAVENQEVAELMAGAAPLQFKLVEGKSNRQWRDEKTAATFLVGKGCKIDQVYPPIPPEIVSPAQAEKALKAVGVKLTAEFKTELSGYTEKPPGKPSLVELSDPRPPLFFDSLQGLKEITDSVYDGI